MTDYVQAAKGELREGHTVTVEIGGHTYEVTRRDGKNLKEALIGILKSYNRADEIAELESVTAELFGGVLPYETAPSASGSGITKTQSSLLNASCSAQLSFASQCDFSSNSIIIKLSFLILPRGSFINR